MKEITRQHTHVEEYKVYEAFDGQEFTDKKECQRYEESALGVLRAKVLKLATSTDKNAWSVMGGMDDHTIIAFLLTEEKQLDYFLQWFYLECPWYLQENHAERKKEVEETINTAFKNKDAILFGKNYDGDYYFINSRQNIIDNLMSL